MKRKFVFGSFMALLSLAVALIATVCLSSCYGKPWQLESNDDCEDELDPYVVECVEATVNPAFTDVNEVMLFHKSMQVDKAFLELQPNVLHAVATVCVKKYGGATRKDIVEEYNYNKDVYDNLPKDVPIQNVPQIITDAKDKKESNAKHVENNKSQTSTYQKIDTVNGKPVKVTVKEERTYENV